MLDEIDTTDRRDQADERRVLELGGGKGLCDGDDASHDGVNAAEIGIAAGSESRDGEGAVGEHEAGIEGAEIAVLQAACVGDRVFCGGGILPSDGGSGRNGDRPWNEVGRAAFNNDGGNGGRCGGRPGREQSYGEQ